MKSSCDLNVFFLFKTWGKSSVSLDQEYRNLWMLALFWLLNEGVWQFHVFRASVPTWFQENDSLQLVKVQNQVKDHSWCLHSLLCQQGKAFSDGWVLTKGLWRYFVSFSFFSLVLSISLFYLNWCIWQLSLWLLFSSFSAPYSTFHHTLSILPDVAMFVAW